MHSFKMHLFVAFLGFLAATNAKVLGPNANTIFPNGRIIGGENVLIEQYPYQVSLQEYDQHICGGTIISEYHILTAGHCASKHSRLTVRTGSSYRKHGGTVHKVANITRHEHFEINHNGVPINDVSIIRLAKPIVFDKFRKSINLFKVADVCEPGTDVTITGWGDTGRGLAPNQLQRVSVPIISQKLCTHAYESYGGLPKGQVCASYYGKGGKDSCAGDSGGPMMLNGRLAGIVSWGNGCAEPYYPGVYTEVAKYRKWIDSHLAF